MSGVSQGRIGHGRPALCPVPCPVSGAQHEASSSSRSGVGDVSCRSLQPLLNQDRRFNSILFGMGVCDMAGQSGPVRCKNPRTDERSRLELTRLRLVPVPVAVVWQKASHGSLSTQGHWHIHGTTTAHNCSLTRFSHKHRLTPNMA